MNKPVLLLALLCLLPNVHAMAGTNALKLRRPRMHRHLHDAPGYISSKPHVAPSVEEAVAAAKRFKAQHKIRIDFLACRQSRNTIQADECVLQYLGTAEDVPEFSPDYYGVWGM
jgi:hypothetical protein